jgi:uncharacterized membrane protein YedE/YeeE
LSFLLCDRPIACSTTYSRASGMIEAIFNGGASEREYFRKFKPEIEWQGMLVAGIFIGSFLSAVLSGEFAFQAVPSLWAENFSGGWLSRYAASFAGGVLLGIGSRWAGGCTSGHGISGALQLTVSSWLAVVIFFASGILSANLLFGVL